MHRVTRHGGSLLRLVPAAALVALAFAGGGCETQGGSTTKGWLSAAEMYDRALALEALGMERTAHAWYHRAAEAGHPVAQVEVGFLHRYGSAGFLRDPYEARRWFLRAARERVPRALADFAVQNDYGEERSSKNLREAERWFRRGVMACHAAALRGDLQAQTLLGGLYGAGAGVEQDRGKALQLWRDAAQRGYGPAQLILGRLYWHEGRYADARPWLRAAAAQDLPEAEYLLSDLYQFGRSVPPDRAEALRWLRRSADHGYAFAQRQLRGMEIQGLLD